MHPFDGLYRRLIATFRLRKLAVTYARKRMREAVGK